MKKFLNAADDLVGESLAGLETAYSSLLRVHRRPDFVARIGGKPRGHVAVISGGGSGHEPLHVGFVGTGMLDAACPGAIFTSPTPDQILAAADAVEVGGGVLLVVKNYDGDRMNFEMAAEMMDAPCARVIVDDDVAGGDARITTGRRGVAGTVVVEKLVGAHAEAGADLEACRGLGERVVSRTRSMGVALSSCTVPAVGGPMFALGDDEMEMGVGIHGERGRRRVAMHGAEAIAADMIEAIVAELPGGPGEVLLLTNGFAGTPLVELHLMHGLGVRQLGEHGLTVTRSLVGNYCTCMDMAGCSFTVTRLDPELTALWDAPVCTPALGCWPGSEPPRRRR